MKKYFFSPLIFLCLIWVSCKKPQGIYQGFFLSNQAIVVVGPGQKVQRYSPTGSAPKELYNANQEGLASFLPDQSGVLLQGKVLVDGAEQYSPISFSIHPDDSPIVGAVMTQLGSTTTMSQDGSLRFWEWENEISQNRRSLKKEATDPLIYQAAFSSDGKRLLTWYQRSSVVKLWDTQTGKMISAFTGPTDTIVKAVLSPDKIHVFIASKDGTVWVYADNSAVRDPPWVLAGKTTSRGTEIVDIAVAHQLPIFVTVDTQGTISVWEVLFETVLPYRNQIRLLQTEFVSQAVISSIGFSSDDQNIILVGEQGRVMVLHYGVGASFQLTGAAVQQQFSSAAISADGEWLVTTPNESNPKKNIYIWNTADIQSKGFGATFRKVFPESDMGITSVATQALFTPDGNSVVSGYKDGSIWIWDVQGKTQNPWNAIPGIMAQSNHTLPISALAISEDQQLLATASWDRTVALFDMKAGNQGQRLFSWVAHTTEVTTIAFSSDHRFLATGGKDQNVILWDIINPEIPVLLSQYFIGNPINRLVINRATRDLFVAGREGKVTQLSFIDPKNLSLVTSWQAHTLMGEQQPIFAMALAIDGQTLLTGGKEGNTFLWNTQSKQVFASYCYPDPTSALCVYPFLGNFPPLPILDFSVSKQKKRIAITNRLVVDFIHLSLFERLLDFQANP